MADPLLTSLCTICRVQVPKYKCPRCGTRTCSLACIKKHKKWASCNGERDPTVFVPPSKLRTAAGIDHDYNFLHKIERSVEQADKIFKEEREILPQDQSQEPPNKRARLHKGRSRGRATLDDSSRRWDRNCLYRLRQLGIKVSSVPYGMARCKENQTSWNKRTRTINWQVEWLLMEGGQTPKTTRILHKILDETPLSDGFASSLDNYRISQLSNKERNEEKKSRRKENRENNLSGMEEGRHGLCQDSQTLIWHSPDAAIQDPTSSAWDAQRQTTTRADDKEQYDFYFRKPNTPSREPSRLIPLARTAILATSLPGLNVLEFPTIYVFPLGFSIPDGFIVEKTQNGQSQKRNASAMVEYESSGGEEGAESEGFQASEDGEASESHLLADEDMTSSSGSESDTDMD
jgi:hypothetical protein